jgi:hypothetical protein
LLEWATVSATGVPPQTLGEMKSILTGLLFVTLSACPLPAQHVANAKSGLMCQGEYSFVSNDAKGMRKAVTIDRWHMDSVGDGSYSVIIDVLFPSGVKAEERRTLTKELKPKTYALAVSTKASGHEGSIKIECDYGMTELSCRTTDNSSSGSEKLRQKTPYLFWPIEDIAPFDFPWGFQSLASQAERVIGHKTSMPFITLDDSEGTTNLKIKGTQEVEYLGQEVVEVAGQRVLASKFRVIDSKSTRVGQLWLSESGILLSADLGDGGTRIELTQYQGSSLSP